MSVTVRLLTGLFCLLASAAFAATDPGSWVPVRWDGGPLELVRRAEDKAFLQDATLREATARWYEPATLDLLAGTPVNCLLLTFSAGADSAIEKQQQQSVREYARLAHERGFAVLGTIHSGSDPGTVATAAGEARLDGLVLEGEFPAGFAARLETELRAQSSTALVIPIIRDPAAGRVSKAAVLAFEGVRPDARNLSDSGIRAGASAEPWIDSNIWLVRSFRQGKTCQPVWVNQRPPNAASAADYMQGVADAAIAGGRWIVALDDTLRARLFHRESRGMAAWRGIAAYLQFAESHREWRTFLPYGNLAIILDTAGQTPDLSNEYLNLATRRHVPYRILPRSELTAASLAAFRSVLAFDLSPATAAERAILCDFAEKGGLVVTGPSWGDPPKDESYRESSLGRGRVAIYKDHPPDPEAAAKDLADLIEPEAMGFSVFNVPSGITDVSVSGKRVLVQILNYADQPGARVAVRLNGRYESVRLYTPEDRQAELKPEPAANGRTEVLIAKPARWAALLFE
jgi:hypothetical protein